MLGAGLITALQKHDPTLIFEGIGGKNMLETGFTSHYPIETLSVMGITEVLRHFRKIKHCRDQLLAHFLANPPDLFIGIDAPDFNLGLERRLKAAGIPTAHYVSPSVWAWRPHRLKTMPQTCDLMLVLFPFEMPYYIEQEVPVKFVGHPLADQIPLEPETSQARLQLDLETDATWVALLPGSRVQEIKHLTLPFLQTAAWLHQQRPNLNLQFIVPLNNPTVKTAFLSILQTFKPHLPLTWIEGHSHQVIQAADVILLASGTATLEALLFKKPMVVAYKLSPLTYQIAKHLVHIPHFSLPNLIINTTFVPEFLQDKVQPSQLGPAVLNLLENTKTRQHLIEKFNQIHHLLRRNANQEAAATIIKYFLK